MKAARGGEAKRLSYCESSRCEGATSPYKKASMNEVWRKVLAEAFGVLFDPNMTEDVAQQGLSVLPCGPLNPPLSPLSPGANCT